MTRTLLSILGLLLLAPAAATATGDAVAEYSLGEGLSATINDDGVITLSISDGVFTAPALTCVWPRAIDPRLKADPEIFVTRAREGDVHGRRGFSHDADDDGDGQVDEDPLDGVDNDHDGAIDEDFAAISHAMAVWDWRHGGRSRHLETYHWSYPHLVGLLAAVFTAGEGANPDPLVVTVPDASWIQTDEFCFHAATAGPAFMARIPDPRRSGHDLWLGIAVLDGESRRQSSQRVHASRDELTVPIVGSRQAIVLAVGPTRLRVSHDLAAAIAIRDGVTDPVSGQRVAWLPAAMPATVTATRLPAAELRPDPDNGFDLALTYTDEPRLRFDPDLFALGATALDGPVALTWIPADGGKEVGLSWPVEGGLVDACHPYDQLDLAGPGTLVLSYAGSCPTLDPGLEPAIGLDGVLEDGRRAAVPVTVLAPVAAEPKVEVLAIEPDDQRLHLSPALLSNYPNPFRSSTRVTFQIPATAGEAFEWEGEGEPPFDPRQSLPYAGGATSVSVVVYDLEGREIAVLQDGVLGVGQYHASWDGTDQIGRIMASGAYFCKLQIENWSVTKRLVFIR